MITLIAFRNNLKITGKGLTLAEAESALAEAWDEHMNAAGCYHTIYDAAMALLEQYPASRVMRSKGFQIHCVNN